MAHKQKYTRGAVGHMFMHYDRSKVVPNLKKPINTALNYNLASNDQPKKQLDFLHQRLGEVKVHNRKDINVMVDWLVTLPKSLKDKGIEDQKRFFQESYKFLNDRYGKQNVISAFVHMDESTPHMHYAFVPVVVDRKKGGYKLSAKEAVTRQDLRTFHKDFSEYMQQVFGCDIGVLNEMTREGNKSIIELKRGTAREQLQNTMKITQEMIRKAQNLEKAIQVAKTEKKGLQDEIEGLHRDILTAQQVKHVPHTKALLGDKQVLATADFNALCKTAATAEILLREIKPARNINAKAQKIINQAKEKASLIISNAEKESIQAQMHRAKRISSLENKLLSMQTRLSKTLALLPEKLKDKFLSAWNKVKANEKKQAKLPQSPER